MSENTETFRLINYQQRGNDAATLHTGLVLGDRIVPFEALAAYYPIAQKLLRACTSSALTPGIEGLLANWEQSFNELSELAALVAQRLAEESLWQKESFALEEVHALSPVLRPTKMLFTGANYQQHVKQAEDWKEGINKSTTKPYAFIKLPYNIIGPSDAVVYPHPYHQLDWEGELGLVIGRRGTVLVLHPALIDT